MVYAIPRFENDRCLLRFKHRRPEPVILTHIVIRAEPAHGGLPEILKGHQLELPPNVDVDFDVTDALIEHVAVSDPEERVTLVHFDLSYEQEDAQPAGLYTVVSRGKSVVAFGS